jgi:hypothetical protein
MTTASAATTSDAVATAPAFQSATLHYYGRRKMSHASTATSNIVGIVVRSQAFQPNGSLFWSTGVETDLFLRISLIS